MKKAVIIITSLVLVITVLFIAWFYYKPTKTSYFVGCVESTINPDNLPEVIGITDYVFVGYVEETYDYNHDRFFHKFPKVIDYYSGEPFTECKVRVIKSIKGNIEPGTIASYYKVGGVTWLRTRIYLPVEEGKTDYYPEKGKYYIFRGGAHPDGTLTGGGTYSTDLLEEGIDSTNYEQSAIYKQWVDAYENQILSQYDSPYHYLCTADVNYGDGTHNAEVYARYIEERYNGEKKQGEYYEAIKDGNPKIP